MKPSIEFQWMTPSPLQIIERAGRTCYKSEDRITDDSAKKFVRMLIDRGHEAMIEHASIGELRMKSYAIDCFRTRKNQQDIVIIREA